MANEPEKQAAARAGLKFIHDGDVVGLGTGSTAAYVIQFLGQQIREGLKIRGIPTSETTRDLAEHAGIPLSSFEEVNEVDVAIDGADEIDPDLNLIKGGGGALLREKIVASAARKFVVIADSSKQVPALGAFPLPVEVIPFAESLLARRITGLGAKVTVRKDSAGHPFRTDEGHHILDCHFGRIDDPAALARTLGDMPGVVEHGLFVGMADVVLIGKGTEVLELQRSAKVS
jgi:ribose 5-phosphate isomerase A